MELLKIKNLTVSIENKVILNDFNLTINEGEIHTLMGPNGIGKSTLTKVIMGDPSYKIETGKIFYKSKAINNLSVDERSRLGIFLGMQLPMEIEGVSNADFLRSAISVREGEKFKLYDFIKNIENNVENLKMNKDMIHRDINVGFSGGEKKKNEILQMYMLKPNLVMLDEIDSGLDVDSLKIVGTAINEYFEKYNPGIILITHYQRLLNYVKPTHVHIIKNGTIVESGDYKLVKRIEDEGFENIKTKKSVSIGTCAVREKLKNE